MIAPERGCRPRAPCFGPPLRNLAAGHKPARRSSSQRARGSRSDLFGGGDGALQLRAAYRKALKQLSNLELAIAELAAIAGLSAVGTVVPQNESTEFYVSNYPEGAPLDFHLIWALQWDHVYTANYFLALLGLLAASLAACSATRQWGMVKVANRWRFARTPRAVAYAGSAENSVTLPDAQAGDLGRLLRGAGYQVFLQQGALYAFKGIAGRFAPIGVHISMLLVIAGTTIGALGGLQGSVMVPEDGDFVLSQPLRPKSFVARPSGALQSALLHVDDFEIKYRPDGSVGQFISEVSVREEASGRELAHKVISVNDPLQYQGLTAYQTDWSIAALTVRVRNPADAAAAGAEPPVFNLPVASLEGQPGISGKLWATFLPAEAPARAGASPRGVSLVMRDMQSVVLYDSRGEFVGVRRPGSNKPIEIEGLEVTVVDMVGSTGLELKVDPGVPYVYAGFGGLMVTTAISYLSHSQVWALQDGRNLHVSGKSNRATVNFQSELAGLVERVPERPS